MKKVISFIAAAIVLTLSAQAQLTTLPGDQGAVLISRMPIVADVASETYAKKGDKVQLEIMVWRTSGGNVELTVETPSITPSSYGIDYVTTKEVFSQVSASAVREAALRGYFGPTGAQTKVWYESNVERTGSSTSTRWAACSQYTAVERTYTVVMNNGTPVVTDLTTTSYPNACTTPSGSIQ
jgi:hypothetical protein